MRFVCNASAAEKYHFIFIVNLNLILSEVEYVDIYSPLLTLAKVKVYVQLEERFVACCVSFSFNNLGNNSNLYNKV